MRRLLLASTALVLAAGATQAQQLPNLLSGYATTPPWQVAGVNYAVGVPSGAALQNPTAISVPGVSVNATSQTVTVSGSNVTLSGYDFAGWGVAVAPGATNTTITNSNFAIGSNNAVPINAATGSGNLTVKNSTFDGGGTTNGAAWALIDYNGSGTFNAQYNSFKNAPEDAIDLNTGKMTANVTNNLFQNLGTSPGAHPDPVQFVGVNSTNSTITGNTIVQSSTSGMQGIQIQAQNGSNLSNTTVANNTIVAHGSTGQDMSYSVAVIQNAGNTINGVKVANNYIDSSGAWGPWYPPSGSNLAFGGNVNLSTGATIPNPSGTSAAATIAGTVLSALVPSASAQTPSTATINVSGGGNALQQAISSAPSGATRAASIQASLPTPCGSTTPATTPGASNGFTAAGGQIVGPNGQPFVARGVNVMNGNGNPSAAQLQAAFPGVNFVRLAIYNYDSPASLSAYVNDLTSHGIVTELEDHVSSSGQNAGGGDQNGNVPFSGAQLANENAWYSSVASAFAGNPNVWFGTNNEPAGTGAQISAWQQQTYQAIRSTGNNNPILLEAGGTTASAYTGMSNVVWDQHYYGWLTNYSTDQATVSSNLASTIAADKAVANIPVIIAEYGNATDPDLGLDANGNQVIAAVQQSGLGSAAWAWGSGNNGGDGLTNSDGSPSAYGQQVAAGFSSGSGTQGCTQSAVSQGVDAPSKPPSTPAPVGPVIGGTTGDTTSAPVSPTPAAPTPPTQATNTLQPVGPSKPCGVNGRPMLAAEVGDPPSANGQANYSSFTAAMGQAPVGIDTYLQSTPDQFPSSAAYSASSVKTGNPNAVPIVGVPMAVSQNSAASDFQAIANGNWDSALNGAFKAFADAGQKTVIIRPGWEMNGSWEPWSVNPGNAAGFVAAFQHIATLAHNYPVMNIQVDWNPGYVTSSTSYMSIWPGKDYVDSVGIDTYGAASGVPDTAPLATSSDPNNFTLQDAIKLALANGKALALPETGAGPGDTAFPANLANVITSSGVPVSFVAIWDDHGGCQTDCHWSDDAASSAAWKAMWTAIQTTNTGEVCDPVGSVTSGTPGASGNVTVAQAAGSGAQDQPAQASAPIPDTSALDAQAAQQQTAAQTAIAAADAQAPANAAIIQQADQAGQQAAALLAGVQAARQAAQGDTQ